MTAFDTRLHDRKFVRAFLTTPTAESGVEDAENFAGAVAEGGEKFPGEIRPRVVWYRDSPSTRYERFQHVLENADTENGAVETIDGVPVDVSSDRLWDEATYQALMTPVRLFQDIYENRPDQHDGPADLYSEDAVDRAMDVGN